MAVQSLCAAMESNSTLTRLDLGQNWLRETAPLLIPIVAGKENIKLLKLSGRIERHVMAALHTILMKRNQKKKKGKGKGKGKKKKK